MRLTLRQKLVIGFSLAFCGIIAGFGVLVLHNNGERYQRQSYAYCRRIVQANIDLTDNYFEQLRNVVRIVVSDQDIINAVNYRVHNPDIDYSIELYNQRKVAAKIKQFDVLGDVKNAIIVGPGGEYLYYYGTSLARGYAFGEQAWFSGAVGTNRMEFINYHPTDYLLGSTGEQTVSLVAPILNSSQYFLADPAYLLCDFSLEPILGDPGRDGAVQIAVYSGSDPVYVPAQLGLAGAQQAQLAAYIEAGERSFLLDACPENASGYLVVSETSEVSGWLILGVMPLDSIQELRSTNRTFVAVLMLVAFAVILAVSSLLARSVLVPMNTLIQKFNAIGRGEKDVRFEKTASVEVDRIAETAMQMLEKNDRLTAEVVEEGRQRAQAQMRALQHQINPHFLNNVLQSMKALAVCGDTEAISKMATLLGRLLAYSVYDPYDMVPLASEFEYTETYIALQNVRFQNKILCTVDLPEEAKRFMVPKLIIQPLAENAIEHGFLPSEGGHIALSADLDEKDLYIAVTNTGRAIEPGQVEKLNRMLHEKKAETQSASIGMLNVLARLQSSFGGGADLRVMSRDGMNTSIVLTLPYTKEE